MASNSTNLYCSYYPSSSPYTLSVSIVENSTNQVNNTSNITITATIRSGGIHFADYYTPTLSVRYKDNGSQTSYTTKASTGVTYITSGTPSWTVTWTGDVTHKSDGTLTGTVEAVWDWKTSGTGYAPYSGSVSVSLNMTTIARAGSINATPSSANVATTNGSTIFTATVTPANSAFYHYVYAQIGSAYALTGRWAEDNAYTFRVNDTSILSAIGNSTSATITFTCKTYATKSTSGTLIGTTTVSRSVTVNTSVIKPSLTGVSASIKTTPVSSNMVAGYSTANINFKATAGYGSNSCTTTVTLNRGTMATSSTSSTSAVSLATNIVPASATDYTLTATIKAVDGRGASVSTTVSITVKGYSSPVPTLTAYRVASSGSTTYDEAGTYVYVKYSATVTAVGNNSVQSQSVTYSGDISGTVSSNPQWIALAEDKGATFVYTVTDRVTSSVQTIAISVAFFPLDLYQNGSSMGAAFGKIATTPGALEIAQDWSLVADGKHNKFNYMPNSFQTGYSAGNQGYARIAQIVLTSTWAGMPITFVVRRVPDLRPVNLYLTFPDEGTVDPATCTLFYEDISNTYTSYSFIAFAVKEGTSTWGVYVRKAGASDNINVESYVPTYMQNRCNINYTEARYSSVPSGAILAKALPPAEPSVTFTKTSGGSYASEIHMDRQGALCILSFKLLFESSTAVGGNCYIGTVNGPRPRQNTSSATYHYSSCLVARLATDGTLAVRVTGAATSNQADSATFTLVYFTND